MRISFINRRLSFFTGLLVEANPGIFPLGFLSVTKLGRFAQKRERRRQLMCGNASDPDE